MGDSKPDKATGKRRAIRWIILLSAIFCMTMLLLFALDHSNRMSQWILSLFSKRSEDNSTPSYSFYEGDYSEEQLQRYEELDRFVHYRIGGETLTVGNEEDDFSGVPGQLVRRYFDALVTGDVESYNRLFSESYYQGAKPAESFKRQLAYDILVQQVRIEAQADGTLYTLHVDYKLFLNNGTLRRDIPSDSSRTQVFVVRITPDGSAAIDKVTTVYLHKES